MKRAAFFDIDGTIFRSSLLIEIVDALVAEGAFPESARDAYRAAYREWLDREGSYEAYIKGVIDAFEKHIVGMRADEFARIADTTVESRRHRVYRFTRDLIAELKAKDYFIVAISNSPRDLVERFAKSYGFDKAYGRIYETDAEGKFTGETLYRELVSDKAKLVARAVEKEGLTLDGSVAVGDTESDIPMLALVERPVCFNPNAKLYEHAAKESWEIAVERKDVIYRINER